MKANTGFRSLIALVAAMGLASTALAQIAPPSPTLESESLQVIYPEQPSPGVPTPGTIPGEPIPPWLSIVPSGTEFQTGTSFDVEFRISNLINPEQPSLGSYDLDVNFDAGVLSYSSITWGTQLDLFGFGSLQAIDTAQVASGLLNIYEVSYDDVADLDSLQLNDFTLFTLTFAAINPGVSALTLNVNDLGDSLGIGIAPSSVGSASVTVSEVPLPATLPLFAAGLLTLMRRRRPA